MGKKYKSVKTGEVLEVLKNKMCWRGRYFSGLVDVKNHALYDNPEDSFADYVGMESSLSLGLIEEVKD